MLYCAYLIKNMRNRAYRRKKSWSKALRKKNICRKYYGWEYYDNLHQYSKNKIHCSCWTYCNWYRFEHSDKHRYKFSDYRKIFKMEQQEKDFDFFEKK